MSYESLKEGWLPKKDAAKLLNVAETTMNRWHTKWPECFEDINGKNANVNLEKLKKKVNKIE